MTRDELFSLLTFLKNVRHSEYVADQMIEGECDELITLVNKDIKLTYAGGPHAVECMIYSHGVCDCRRED